MVIRCKLSEVRVYMSPRPRSLAIRHREDLQCVFFGSGNTLASLFFKLALDGVESRHVCKLVGIV